MLWEHDAAVMSQALVMHDEVLRSQLQIHGGLELMTEGDAFLVCFSTPIQAMKWCFGVQTALMEVKWPEALLSNGLDSTSTVQRNGTEVIWLCLLHFATLVTLVCLGRSFEACGYVWGHTGMQMVLAVVTMYRSYQTPSC